MLDKVYLINLLSPGESRDLHGPCGMDLTGTLLKREGFGCD